MAEFTLVFPLFVLILAVCFTSSQALTSVIGLNSAARAGAIAAANDISANPATTLAQETADATTAVNAEQGCSSGSCPFVAVASAASCPATKNCVWITAGAAGDNSTGVTTTVEIVHVTYHASSFVPLMGRIFSVQVQAGATP